MKQHDFCRLASILCFVSFFFTFGSLSCVILCTHFAISLHRRFMWVFYSLNMQPKYSACNKLAALLSPDSKLNKCESSFYFSKILQCTPHQCLGCWALVSNQVWCVRDLYAITAPKTMLIHKFNQ